MSREIEIVQPVGQHYVDVPVHAPGEIIRVELLEPRWACLVLDEVEPYCGRLHGVTQHDDIANALDLWGQNPILGRRTLLQNAERRSSYDGGVRGPDGESLGDFEYMTAGEFRACARRMAAGIEIVLPRAVRSRRLQAPRSEAGDTMAERVFLGICGVNSAEWFMGWAAALHCGFVEVPMQHTMLEEQLTYIAKTTGMMVALIDAASLPIMRRVAERANRLSLLVVIDLDLGVPSHRVVPPDFDPDESSPEWLRDDIPYVLTPNSAVPGGPSYGPSSGTGEESDRGVL